MGIRPSCESGSAHLDGGSGRIHLWSSISACFQHRYKQSGWHAGGVLSLLVSASVLVGNRVDVSDGPNLVGGSFCLEAQLLPAGIGRLLDRPRSALLLRFLYAGDGTSVLRPRLPVRENSSLVSIRNRCTRFDRIPHLCRHGSLLISGFYHFRSSSHFFRSG